MDLAENRFGKTWKHFLEVLKVDYNCSLADVCRDQHTTLGGMSSWMSRRGYSCLLYTSGCYGPDSGRERQGSGGDGSVESQI